MKLHGNDAMPATTRSGARWLAGQMPERVEGNAQPMVGVGLAAGVKLATHLICYDSDEDLELDVGPKYARSLMLYRRQAHEAFARRRQQGHEPFMGFGNVSARQLQHEFWKSLLSCLQQKMVVGL